MNISLTSENQLTGASFEHGSVTENMSCKFSDCELIDALISLAKMLDAAQEATETPVDERKDCFVGTEGEVQDRFFFLSGWDRLMSRFRDSCISRSLYRVCF